MRTWMAIGGGACIMGSMGGLMTACFAGQYNPRGIFVGNAMNIRQRTLCLFSLSALGQGIISVAFPLGRLTGDLQCDIPAFLTLAIVRLVVAGIIPIIYWAMRRFSKGALDGVTATWAILIVVIVWLQYWALFS